MPRAGRAARDDVLQWLQITGFVVAGRVEARACSQPALRNRQHLPGDVAQFSATGQGRVEREPGYRRTQGLAPGHVPILDQVPCCIERALIVQQPDPERGQRTDLAPRSTIGAAHFEERFQPHFGKCGG